MSNILEYVVSGTSYMRLSNPAICRDDTNTEIVNMLCKIAFEMLTV